MRRRRGHDIHVLRSSLGPLEREGRRDWTQAGSLSALANMGTKVPPLGGFILRRSVFAAMAVWIVVVADYLAGAINSEDVKKVAD